MAPLTDVPSLDATEVPPLEAGDHLSRAEFHRRYAAMPDLKKAELIEGIVHLGSPVRHDQHGKPHGAIVWSLQHYAVLTPGVEASDNPTVILDGDNEPQPDAILRILPEFGGSCQTTPKGYLQGPPELVAEITASSASYDLHEKKRVYQRCGALEYLVWKVREKEILWLRLVDGVYAPIEPECSGVVRSQAFPGLWLDVCALVGGDLAQVLTTLQAGLASPEHAAFCAGIRPA